MNSRMVEYPVKGKLACKSIVCGKDGARQDVRRWVGVNTTELKVERTRFSIPDNKL
jgi:hypothetical protein